MEQTPQIPQFPHSDCLLYQATTLLKNINEIKIEFLSSGFLSITDDEHFTIEKNISTDFTVNYDSNKKTFNLKTERNKAITCTLTGQLSLDQSLPVCDFRVLVINQKPPPFILIELASQGKYLTIDGLDSKKPMTSEGFNPDIAAVRIHPDLPLNLLREEQSVEDGFKQMQESCKLKVAEFLWHITGGLINAIVPNPFFSDHLKKETLWKLWNYINFTPELSWKLYKLIFNLLRAEIDLHKVQMVTDFFLLLIRPKNGYDQFWKMHPKVWYNQFWKSYLYDILNIGASMPKEPIKIVLKVTLKVIKTPNMLAEAMVWMRELLKLLNELRPCINDPIPKL